VVYTGGLLGRETLIWILISFYPVGKDIYLKIRIGLSAAITTIDTPSDDDTETYLGTEFLLGIGYDF